MRFAILGAGALGTILGAHLVRAGHDVVLLARGQRAEQLRRDGLMVHGLIELRERCEVITDPAQLRETDCFCVATKAIDTRQSLQPYAHVKTATAFSMQNVGLDIGELDGPRSPRVAELTSVIDTAGVRCRAVDDIKTREWSKFVAWCGLVPLATLTRHKTWIYLSDPTGARVAVRVVREVAALAKAIGVPLIDLSPLPAVTLTTASDEEAVRTVIEIGERFKEVAPEHRMSALQDIERGSRLELAETLGYALERGRELGIAMPTLQLSYEFLSVGR
jgi:2-dehydropantoate 2-reductase